jgi:hypothetical protein
MILHLDVFTLSVEYRILDQRNGVLGAYPYTSTSTQASSIWHVAFAVAIYSDSQLDWITTICFIDCKVTGLFAKKKMSPVVLFLASTSPAKSTSLNLVNNA